MKRTHTFYGIFLLFALLLTLSTGCARPNAREALAGVAPRAPEGSPRLLAIYQPWFGQSSHINVGYSCHDPNILRQQIARAREMNISGFVVNWYGPRKEFEDQSYALLQQAAAEAADSRSPCSMTKQSTIPAMTLMP